MHLSASLIFIYSVELSLGKNTWPVTSWHIQIIL